MIKNLLNNFNQGGTEEAAQTRPEAMIPALAKETGATESLKAADQLKWVGIMNSCKAQAEEIAVPFQPAAFSIFGRNISRLPDKAENGISFHSSCGIPYQLPACLCSL